MDIFEEMDYACEALFGFKGIKKKMYVAELTTIKKDPYKTKPYDTEYYKGHHNEILGSSTPEYALFDICGVFAKSKNWKTRTLEQSPRNLSDFNDDKKKIIELYEISGYDINSDRYSDKEFRTIKPSNIVSVRLAGKYTYEQLISKLKINFKDPNTADSEASRKYAFSAVTKFFRENAKQFSIPDGVMHVDKQTEDNYDYFYSWCPMEEDSVSIVYCDVYEYARRRNLDTDADLDEYTKIADRFSALVDAAKKFMRADPKLAHYDLSEDWDKFEGYVSLERKD